MWTLAVLPVLAHSSLDIECKYQLLCDFLADSTTDSEAGDECGRSMAAVLATCCFTESSESRYTPKSRTTMLGLMLLVPIWRDRLMR